MKNPAGTPENFDSHLEIDVKTTYSINSTNSVTVGIRNLFDRQPPFSSVDDWPFYSQSTYKQHGSLCLHSIQIRIIRVL